MAKISFTAELASAFAEREKRQALDIFVGELNAARLVTNKKGTVCLELDIVGKGQGITFDGKSIDVSTMCRIYNIALTKAILNAGISTKNDDSTLIVAADGGVTVKKAVVADTVNPVNPANPFS